MNIAQTANHLRYFAIKEQTREAFKEIAPEHIKGDVLDIGSGLNPYKKLIKYKRYFTIDNNPKLKPDIIGDILNIPVPDNKFDSIICTDVLEHVNEPLKAMNEMNRVLKSGGFVYILVPFIWNLHYEPNDYFRYTKYGLMHLLKSSGFKMVKMKQVGGIFAFVGARISRLIYDIFIAIFFIFPSKIKVPIAILASLPNSLLFYILSKCFDRFSKSPVSFVVLATKTKK